MTQPTPEELLRLARKAGIVKPDWEPHRPKTLSMQLCSALGTWLTVVDLSGPPGVNMRETAQAEALRAALKVLAGEAEDVAALLAELDRLRERLAHVRDLVANPDLSYEKTCRAILEELEDP